ncbi:MAG: flagellar filament capping protein FliD [Lachnospiraceae bacterium]|nr:flagellar filament capping protein FliD [Lachnospiraceae bacterium]
MSSINNDYSGLFSSLSTSQSSGYGSSLESLYGDYSSIKNGSYGKLLKAYYAKQEKTYKAEEADDNKGVYTRVKSNASALAKDADALTSSSLYAKGSFKVTKKDGSTEDSDYDMDNIYEKVSSFVKSYNSTVAAGSAIDSGAVSTRTLSLVQLTTKNKNLLGSIGISISSDGSLSIDEDKFKNADINSIKSLFSGTGSYADAVANKANVISSLASNKLSAYSQYDSKGSYDNTATSNLYNNYL